MIYSHFRERTKKYPVFRSHILTHLTPNPSVLRRQISEWIKKGYILSLKRGLYTLRESDRSMGLSSYFIANQLYNPSYVSLETALSYYGFIPERVSVVTSISTKKTQMFQNDLGVFSYHHIKLECFGDFIKKEDSFGQTFFIATAERAIVDFLYFKLRDYATVNENIFEVSFRFQHMESINVRKMKMITKKFNQKKLTLAVNYLIKKIKEL